MIQSRWSVEREHLLKTLLSSLRNCQEKENTTSLYLESRAYQIVTSFMPESELFSTGFTQIMSKDTPPTQAVDRVVLLAVMGDPAITEL
jgi:hypothetical protein